MASGPITSQQIDGETVVTDFISLFSWVPKSVQMVTAPNYYLPTNVHLVKYMFFPVVIYGCEGWNIKKAEH